MPSPKAHSSLMPDMTGCLIDHGRIRLLAIIGRGAYGIVYRAVDLQSNPQHPRFYAVKCQVLSAQPRMKVHQLREVRLHQQATGHPGVASLRNVVYSGNYIFLVMSFCPDGDLFSMLTERNPFPGNDLLVKTAFMQLIDAVERIHDLGIAHRDLKPENILCRGGQLLLTDFGLATDDRKGMEYGCGSSQYMSPECVGDVWGRIEPFEYAPSDIWALGVVFVNIACNRNPWGLASPSDKGFRAYLHEPRYLQRHLPVTHQLHDVLRAIFTLDPGARITLPQLRVAIARIRVFTTDERTVLRRNPTVRAVTHASYHQVRAPRRKDVPIRIHVLSGEFSEPEADVPVLHVNVSARTLGFEHALADFGCDASQTRVLPPDPAHGEYEDDYEDDGEYPEHMVASTSSMSSVASSVGPTTPEMPAADPAEFVTDLDDDTLDLGDGDWVLPESPVIMPASPVIVPTNPIIVPATGDAPVTTAQPAVKRKAVPREQPTEEPTLRRSKAIKQKDTPYKWKSALKRFRKIVA